MPAWSCATSPHPGPRPREQPGIYPEALSRLGDAGGRGRSSPRRLARAEQPHRRTRRIVRGQGARSTRRVGVGRCERAAQHRFQPRAAELARAQQRRLLARAVDDGRLDADVASAAVQHHQLGPELGHHMRCLRGADAAVAVGAGCRHTGHAQQGRFTQAAPAPPGVRAGAGRCCSAHRPLPRPHRHGAAR